MRDASRLAKDLEEIQKNGVYGDEEIRAYTIGTHALKSALTNIGESELSAVAAKLEAAGRAKDTALIAAETPAFLKALWATIAKHSPQQDTAPADEAITEDLPFLKEKLQAIKTACEVYDRKAIKAVLTDLQEKEWTGKTRELLATLEEYLLNGDFEAVAKTVGE
jgi:HPt (histidine-containing phosphotransfer) domain-containing protein